MTHSRLLLGCTLLALGLASLGHGLQAVRPPAPGAIPRGAGESRIRETVLQNLSNSLAEMEVLRSGEESDIYVSNKLSGPVEVRVTMRGGQSVQADPALPLQQLLAPLQRTLISRVARVQNQFPSFEVSAVPGDPKAIPDEVVYSLPLDETAGWEVGQGFHGGFSHSDEQNRFAVDLIIPEGTPVLAARDGVVMQVESGFDGTGTNRSVYAERANLVRILHDDGTMAIYAHLREGGVLVRAGDRVSIGEQIGISGNTGYSSGPHLHFCVQVNTGMRVVSIPFRMVTSRGFLPLPSQ